MLGELLPVILVPAAALALAIRVPARCDEGSAPIGPQLSQWMMSAALLIAASWLALLVAPAFGPGSDVGGFGLAAILLPAALAITVALRPQTLDAADDRPAPTRVVNTPTPTAEREPEPIEPKPEPEPGPREFAGPQIEDRPASEDEAIRHIASTMGSRPGLVFSPHAEPRANTELARIAAHLQARRYISVPPEQDSTDSAHLLAARTAAGADAAHASELALDLAGGAVDSLLLLDDRIDLSALAVQGLARVEAAVLCAPTENAISHACKVRVPTPADDESRAKLLERLADELGVPAAGTSTLIAASVPPPAMQPSGLASPGRATLAGPTTPPSPSFPAPLLVSSPVPRGAPKTTPTDDLANSKDESGEEE
jgi:hypothetical protein